MFAILTYSTDMRAPDYQIRYTNSKREARQAANTDIRLTHENPEMSRNWHHTLTRVYEMPTNWRKPADKWVREQVRKSAGSIYSPNYNEVIARCIKEDGQRVIAEERNPG